MRQTVKTTILRRLIPSTWWDTARHHYYATREHGWFRSQLRTVVAGEGTRKVAAITFDDGPHPADTPRMLEVLARHQVPATFFFLGRNVEAHPDVARAVVQAGHDIGNHTYDHPHLPSCGVRQVISEVRRCQRAIREATGLSPVIMRPPYGAQSAQSFLAIRALGYQIVHWSASGHDWLGDDASIVAGRVMKGMLPGRIILLHDNLEPPPGQTAWRPEQAGLRDRRPTADALDDLIRTLRGDGYDFVTVTELLRQGTPKRRSWFD